MQYLSSDWPRLTPEMLAKLYKYGWNRRVLTYERFEDFCADEGITVISAPLPKKHPGKYKVEKGREVIKLDPGLSGAELTLTAWHEVGHYLFHVPGQFGAQEKTETVADLIGYTALMPTYLIKHNSDWDISNDYGYPSLWIAERRRLHEIYTVQPRRRRQRRWHT